MACALTHDDPVNDCRDREWTGALVGALLAAGVAVTATVLIVHVRRRRRG